MVEKKSTKSILEGNKELSYETEQKVAPKLLNKTKLWGIRRFINAISSIERIIQIL